MWNPTKDPQPQHIADIAIWLLPKLLWVCNFEPSMIEGSLEVKLPTIWTDEKQSRGKAERRGRLEERR